uniref:Putative secreted protein n=1 Tax=Anopheles darlingi TaxID=43151 RepID=A0A2M4DS86_ANODA
MYVRRIILLALCCIASKPKTRSREITIYEQKTSSPVQSSHRGPREGGDNSSSLRGQKWLGPGLARSWRCSYF